MATAALGASLGVRVPVEPSPSPLFRLRAPAGLVRTVVNTEDFDLRQVAADRLIAAADSPERTLAAVRSTFHGAGSVELLSTRLGVRPMPADGEPIVGPVAEVPGVYLAVMHSAVTLAAAVGRLVARELVDEPLSRLCQLAARIASKACVARRRCPRAARPRAPSGGRRAAGGPRRPAA